MPLLLVLREFCRYTPSTCFATFPFLWENPQPPERGQFSSSTLSEDLGVQSVKEIMKELDEFRLAMMKERNYGITKLYNEFFNEPASKLSKLHESLDEAVCRVYSRFPLSRG